MSAWRTGYKPMFHEHEHDYENRLEKNERKERRRSLTTYELFI
jgi:hypothetical protein